MDIPLSGTSVDDSVSEAMNRAVLAASTGMSSPTFRAAHRVQDVGEDVGLSGCLELLVGYRHPVHRYKHWTVRCTLKDATAFLADHIDEDQGNGLDLFIASEDFSHIWITSHDGEAYRLK